MNRKMISMIFIIISGEAIFMIPFLIPRLYRPLMLEAWHLTNTDIGTAFSAYGISAMFSYILGGNLADKYSPRYLMTISLFMTALGSIYLLFFPSRSALIFLYFFFGISTIFLMWGALIKVTHMIGGEEHRSTAMGILDSGRGLSAAIMSSFLVLIVSLFFSGNPLLEEKETVLKAIYLATIIFTILISAVLWWSLREFEVGDENDIDKWNINKTFEVLKDIRVWLLGIIILSAYCGYKSIDNYSIYLVDVQEKSLESSSMFTSLIFWLRPISALIAGVMADKLQQKFKEGRLFSIFVLLFLGCLLQLMLAFEVMTHFSWIFGVILFSAAFAYALRSIYFSIFGDMKVKNSLIGTTVGVVSFVGFLPDMFFGVVTGKLIDTYPGKLGHSYSFIFNAVVLCLGATAALLLIYLNRKNYKET